MFPFEDADDELTYDDYGASLRPGEFQSTEAFDAGEGLQCSRTERVWYASIAGHHCRGRSFKLLMVA